MEPFKVERGIVAALDRANVDTDQIIPKQFLKSIKRTGFGESLFFDWRYLPSGAPDPGFSLNAERFRGASILVVRNNFGCGSSREHAVWAVVQAGYRVVIAPTVERADVAVPAFADIFASNSVKNGLLTVTLTEPEVEEIFQTVARCPGLEASVDLEEQKVVLHAGEEMTFHFEFPSAAKDQLLRGLDEIAMALEHDAAITVFEASHDAQMPAA